MDNSTKRECIKAITDEVGVLHPLLEGIFPKLTGIVSYEYTHGVHERGADFVLERTDAALDRRTYIGVVAKACKITANIAEVEEQIRECEEQRPYRQTEKVRCTEVWVFSAQGYSERAKEKIQERFRGRTIQFFGPEDLVRFVDGHNPFFWSALPHDLGSYFQVLTGRLKGLDEATAVSTVPRAESLQIDLDTFERFRRPYTDKGRSGTELRNVDFMHEAKKAELSVLEADLGCGKSWLVRRLVQSMCSPEAYKKAALVPVFSSVKTFIDRYNADLDLLMADSLGKSIEVLNDKDINVVCVLDGLDEVGGNPERAAQLFQSIADSAKSRTNIRLVITTRPNRSLEQHLSLNNRARTFGIRPVSLQKLVHYLEQCCTKAKLPQRLYEDLKKSPLFRQLPQSPIAAALLSNLLAQNQQEVPQSLTELYAKSVELMLGRWEERKNSATETKFQTASLLAERLAEYFVENELVYVSKSEAVGIVQSYFKKREIGFSADEAIEILFDRSNIFCRDVEADTISFRHRSFAEFLCAKRKYRERNWNLEEVILNPAWSNVLFFYAGLRMDCADLIAQVQNMHPRNEFEEWMKVVAVPSYMLAAYQTEFEIVEHNMHHVLLDAAKLYMRVRSGNTRTKLTELSEMQLLYLFKSVVVESFAYKYFEAAFDSILLHIDDWVGDYEVKSYARFFLGCVGAELGNESIFRYVCEIIGIDKVPLPISFAMRLEMESHTNLDKSPLLRAHRARLQKLLFASTRTGQRQALSAQNQVEEMFRKPLRTRRMMRAG